MKYPFFQFNPFFDPSFLGCLCHEGVTLTAMDADEFDADFSPGAEDPNQVFLVVHVGFTIESTYDSAPLLLIMIDKGALNLHLYFSDGGCSMKSETLMKQVFVYGAHDLLQKWRSGGTEVDNDIPF